VVAATNFWNSVGGAGAKVRRDCNNCRRCADVSVLSAAASSLEEVALREPAPLFIPDQSVESEEKDCICDIDEPEPVVPDIPMDDIPVEVVPMVDIPIDPMDPVDRTELPSIAPEESMELPSEESEDWPWA